MASTQTKTPGKTAKHYRSNKASREKHSRDNGKGGKYEHSKSYKKEHSAERRKRGIMGKGGSDVSKKGGKYTTESLKINRGRGGAQRK